VTGPTLFDPPPPPTGPQTPDNSARAGSRDAYMAWRYTADGLRVWLFVLERARAMLRSGAKRISTKALVETARGELKLKINNTYTAYLADDLLTVDPAFEKVIERRQRKGR
jgi:hypothetical protein